jgi:TPR repeat protein
LPSYTSFDEAARSGCAESYKSLGDAHWYGTNVTRTKDVKAAQECYEKAMSLGLDSAIPCLARCYWLRKDPKAKELISLFISKEDGVTIADDVIETILDEME